MNVISAEVLPFALRICNPVKRFYRVLVGQTVLYSAEYRRMSVQNSFTINYKQDSVKFGQIQYFLYFSFQILAVIIPLCCESCTAHFGLAHGALDSLPTSQIVRVISKRFFMYHFCLLCHYRSLVMKLFSCTCMHDLYLRDRKNKILGSQSSCIK